jgi:hypothetical protein
MHPSKINETFKITIELKFNNEFEFWRDMIVTSNITLLEDQLMRWVKHF